MEKRFKNAICTDILITDERSDGKYLLLMKRKNTGSDDGYYELPGGHLEKDEDLFESMIREAKEELLIDLKREDLKIIHILHHYHGERLNIIFQTSKNNLKPKIGELTKCEDLFWFRFDNIPNNTTDKVKKILDNIANKVFYDRL